MEAAATTSCSTNEKNQNLTNLDLAFILDCTASMDVYIDHAKENIHLIANEIIQTENCYLRIGLIEYRDHPPQEYTFVTRVHNFTDNIDLARKFISQCSTNGGGDVAESICCGLSDCLNNLEWRDDSVKLAILITDGPPHGLIGVFDDYFPKGCPIDSEKNDPVQVAHKMAEKAITLYCAGCEPSLTFYRPFFIPLTLITGGQYIPLEEANSLSNIIIGGSHEEIFMERLMDQVNNEILKESSVRKEKPIDEEELTKKIHFILNSNSNERKHKRLDHHHSHSYHATPRQKFNEDMKKMSNLKTLDEFNKYIMDNDVRISESNFFIDILDPFPLSMSFESEMEEINSNNNTNNNNNNNNNSNNNQNTNNQTNKKIAGPKRRKNNSDESDEQITEDKRNSSPETSSPDSQDANINESSSESSSNSAIKNNIDGSSNSSCSNSSSMHQSSSGSSSSGGSSFSSSSASLQSSASGTTASSSSTTSRLTHMVSHINIDQARRLVKKSIARNKLNKK